MAGDSAGFRAGGGLGLMIVDAHHHLWDPARRHYPFLTRPGLDPIRRAFTVDDLRERVSRCAVTHTVVVQATSTLDETRELLMLASRSHGLIAGVVGWVDLEDPAVSDTLEALRAGEGGSALVGVRHQVEDEPEPRWLTRRGVVRGLNAVAAQGLTYDLLVRAHQLPAATAAAHQVPQLDFVLDHCGKPPIATGDRRSWEKLLRELAEQPNVTCKLSGLFTEANSAHDADDVILPYLDAALSAFGAHRVMFGSDWPVSELVTGYRQTLEIVHQACATLPAAGRADVLAGTAIRVYGLDLHPGAGEPSPPAVR